MEEQIRAAHEQGLTLAETARRLGVSERTVSRWRCRLGLSPARAREGWQERAQAMAEEGMPVSAIAQATRVDRYTVLRHFPGARWTPSQGGRLSAEIRRARRAGLDV